MRSPISPVGLDAKCVYSYNHSSEEIADTIQNYKPMLPKRLWNGDVENFTRSAVTDFAPTSKREASAAMSAVARLAIWSVHVACQPLERDVVFDGRQVDAFIARGSSGVNDEGTRSLRLRLLRIAAELVVFDPSRRDGRKQPKARPFAPYTTKEIVRFRSQGNTRSTPLRRHNWMTLLTLGAGCALSTSEIVGLRTDDVLLNDDAVRIAVRGDRARTVICLAEWEGDIRLLVSSPLVSTYLFVKTERPRTPPMYVTRFLDTAAKGGEKFTVERLRSTWMVGHLSAGTPAVPLVRMAGVKSFSTFERLFRYVAEPTPNDLTAVFRRQGSR